MEGVQWCQKGRWCQKSHDGKLRRRVLPVVAERRQIDSFGATARVNRGGMYRQPDERSNSRATRSGVLLLRHAVAGYD